MNQVCTTLPVPGVDMPERLCPKCGEPMAVKARKVPAGSKQKNWRWCCVPCTNKQARITHQSPHRQAAKKAYREKNAERIAARKAEWSKQDRIENPAKHQARARRSHEQLMASPERKRAKYDKANERDRLQLLELKKDPVAYEEHLAKERIRGLDKYQRHRQSVLNNSKESYYKTKYGVTLDQLSHLYQAQDCKCAVCGTALPDPATTKTKHGRGQWHLDHSHETGAVRGLLCNRCNMGLGLFKDDSLRLQKAIRYLNGSNRDLVDTVLHGVDARAEYGAASDASSDADSRLPAERAEA